MSHEDVRKYFQRYKLEHMTDSPEVRRMLDSFCANKYGESLEEYLKKEALTDDNNDISKVYLIKNEQNEAVSYFSIKCGLLYEPLNYEKLTDDEKQIVDMLTDAIIGGEDKLLEEYMSSEVKGYEDMERLKKIAQNQIEIQKEQYSLKDASFRVHIAHPAIELVQFCKNTKAQLNETNVDVIKEIPIGMGLFWEIIVPTILKIAEKIGCEYSYLFAADHTGEAQGKQSLLRYYRTNLKFDSTNSLVFIKPTYDSNCWPMCQRISTLRENYKGIWAEFDVG